MNKAGFEIYLLVSLVFIVGAGFHLYGMFQIIKAIREIAKREDNNK